MCDGRDVLMSRSVFQIEKKELYRTLRGKSETYSAQTVRPGKGNPSNFFNNLCALRNEHENSFFVRGWKLYTISLSRVAFSHDAWMALFHVVLAVPSDDGVTFLCPNISHNEGDKNKPFIFLPSSLAHAELRESDVFSNKFILGGVVGGNSTFAQMYVRDQKMRGRRKSVIGISPETTVSKQKTRVFLYPFFEKWFSLRAPDQDQFLTMSAMGELMGFPTDDDT